MTVLLALALALLVPQAPASECAAWQECRARALEAAERREFETFHDLAWRALQAGPRNDPSLMQLLARAQSLSGRPGDALVMLQRLAAMGVATDVSGEDFASVRRLPRWRDLEAQLDAIRPNAAAAPATSPPTPPAVVAPPPAPARTPSGVPVAPAAAEALRFTTPPFTPGGLAYDAVSRRFIVGHRDARKLSVVDEFSRQIANLAGPQATGFADVAALEIDPRDGTLWVVSAGEPAAGRTAPPTSLHKLQLISGRSLASYAPPDDGARFVDVAVAPGGVLVLDAAGRRVFRLRGGARSLDVAAALGDLQPVSLAPAGESVVYVGHHAGIARVELATGKVVQMAANGAGLSDIDWLRWHRGALIALQKTAAGHRLLRVRADGQAEVIDGDVRSPGRAAAAINRDVLYILTRGTGSELVIERLSLK